MKKILIFICLFFLSCGAIAAPISGIVFFGDSLSDNSNLYKLLLKIIPKSPPYFKGRFSNGPTWAEYVGKYYYDKYYVDYANYAFGGATAIYHQPTTKFIAPTTLSQEITQYLSETVGQDKSKVLYSIWIGGNDYLFDQDDDADALTTKVVNKVMAGITSLIAEGGKNFLIINLPDLSKIPFANGNGFNDKLHTLSVMHNQKLANEISLLKLSHPDIKIVFVDIFSIMMDVINDPQKYNQQYAINITDTTQACWQGGFVLTSSNMKQQLKQDIEKRLAYDKKHHADAEEIANFIINSPSLAYVYSLNAPFEQGMMPCANGSEHIFWDKIHPSAIVHQVLAKIILDNLNKEFG